MRNPLTWVGEQVFDISRSVWTSYSMSALRSFFTESLFKRPAMYQSTVDYDLARSLYRNDNLKYNLGAGFVGPIIDTVVEHMGLPQVSSDNEQIDVYLSECISEYWAPQLQEAFRDTMVDSKGIVRFRQPLLTNPLMSQDDRQHGKLELLMPEEVQITYDPTDPDLIERAAITHFIELDDRTDEDIARGLAPRLVTHEIVEIINQEQYRFFDKTAGTVLEEWTTPNTWGFVPIWIMYNEFNKDLSGGISDIERVLPFIEAFHEVLTQALAAHEYHSTPKAQFKIKDIGTFIKNNMPEIWDFEANTVKQGAKITWSGKEVFFMQVDEAVEFVEAKSVLGDSKVLLEFLIDCIAIASETPRWVLVAENSVRPETDIGVEPFEKKVDRKRLMFSEPIKMICKMALVATGREPVTMRISWPTIRTMELVNKGQAIQQIVLALDAAAAHQWIADATVVKIIGSLFPEVSAPDVEMALAKSNFEVLPPAAPPSDTQATSTPKSTNGSGSKSAAKKALTTTAGSNS